jgi:hypothetical protein
VAPRPLADEFRDAGVGVEEVRAMLAGQAAAAYRHWPKHAVSRQQDIAEGVTARPRARGDVGELSREKPVVVYCLRFSRRLPHRDRAARCRFDARYDSRPLRLESRRCSGQDERMMPVRGEPSMTAPRPRH